MQEDETASQLVDAAVAVHRALGPGLLESAYRAALQLECAERRLRFASEAPIHASYRGKPLGVAYRADLIVADHLLIEIKSVRAIEDVHIAQLLSYLRLSNLKLGLLLNFNVPLMKSGIKRVVNAL